MKKIITLFILISTFSFAIPDFDNLKWGFTVDAIRGFYPELKSEFTTSEGVTKFTTIPKDKNSKVGKITFYLFDNKLYKIISTFNPTLVKPGDVQTIYDDYTERFGDPTASKINEPYNEFTIKGNEQTWIYGNTYISLIGQDYVDDKKRINHSELLMEYGLIDPKNRKKDSILNDLIINN